MFLALLLLLSVLGYGALRVFADAVLPQVMEQMVQLKAQASTRTFVQAEESVRRLRLELVQRLDARDAATCQARFAALFVRSAEDGLWRLRPELVDTARTPTFYLHQRTPALELSTCLRAVVSFDLLRERGPALVPPFFAVYMDFVEDGLMGFSHEVDWGAQAHADTSNANYPTLQGSDPARNPARKVFWTPVYFDVQAQTWMVSAIAPLDWQGRWVGTLGQDVAIQALMDSISDRGEQQVGLLSLIMDVQNGLIAHPQFMERIAAAEGSLRIATLGDPVLEQVQHMVAQKKYGAGRTPDGSHWVAWSHIEGPGWSQVLLLPQSQVNAMLLVGLAVLCTLGLLALAPAQWFLRRQVRTLVAVPLQQLTQAADTLAQGLHPEPIGMQRADEMGRLAQAFDLMVGQVQQQHLLSETHAKVLQTEVEERRAVMVHLHQERARLHALLGAMQLGIVFADTHNQVLYSNRAFSALRQQASTRQDEAAAEDALLGSTMEQALEPVLAQLQYPDSSVVHLLRMPHEALVGASLELVLRSGAIFMLGTYPVADVQGQGLGCLWVLEDVTQERKTAQQLIYLAERDALTGLFNRRRFEQELAQFFRQVQRVSMQAAVLFFDLDEFKYVNDTFGHQTGDVVLQRVAAQVREQVRDGDTFCRLGGDEFAVLMPHASLHSAQQLAERIVRTIAQTALCLEGQKLRLTSSLGIAHYPEHASTAQELVSHADMAMYQAKRLGKNRWSVFRPDRESTQEMLSHLAWNDRIERALQQGLFELHFQGVYRAGGGQLAHLEALIRLRDEADTTRLISPGEFIAHAEKSGKILDIDRWVVCQGVAVLAAHPHLPALAINMSGRSFDDHALPAFIAGALARAQVPPERLLLELTETSAVSDLGDAERFIDALRSSGCTLCLDDFGTGFASFAYLKHLKVDVLKIDGLFIRNLPRERDNQVFVRSIIEVARGMGKHTVAEFVEDEATLNLLLEFGIDMVQGYYLDKPQAAHPALQAPKP